MTGFAARHSHSWGHGRGIASQHQRAGGVPRAAADVIRVACAAFVAWVLLASAASGATTWTNPVGGLWSDARNWSAGVPHSSDDVVLPSFDADGATITVDGSFVCASLKVIGEANTGPITLDGGSLGVTGLTTIGGPGAGGWLIVQDHGLQATMLDVGVGTDASPGTGTLEIRGTASVGSGLARLGLAGTSHLAIDPVAKAFGSMWIFFGGSDLEFVLSPATHTPLEVIDLTRGGVVRVTAAEGLALPTSGFTLMKSQYPAGGAFDLLDGPTISGFDVPILAGVTALTIPSFNPIISTEIHFERWPPVVGFRDDLWVVEHRFVGESWSCYSYGCDYAWSVVAGDAAFGGPGVDQDVLVVSSPGETTVQASRDYFGQIATAQATFDPIPESDYHYRRMAMTPDGGQPDHWMEFGDAPARWTPDGRFTVYAHKSSNLGIAPTVDPHPAGADIYVHDAITGMVECASAGVSTVPNLTPDIDGAGRRVAFVSGPSAERQVWLYDRWTGETRLVSRAQPSAPELPEQPGNGPSTWPRISRDGLTVIFTSKATDLGTASVPGVAQVLAYDVPSGTITLVSTGSSGGQRGGQRGGAGTGDSLHPSVSADGRIVVFDTLAPELVPEGGGVTHVIAVDRTTGAVEVIDRSTGGSLANDESFFATITPSGRFVLFASEATNLAAEDTDLRRDAFVRDRLLNTLEWVSPSIPGMPLTTEYSGCAISDDGRFVAYGGFVMVAGEYDWRAMRLDRELGTTDWIAGNPWHEGMTLSLSLMQFTADGQQLLFNGYEQAIMPFMAVWSVQPVAQLFAPLNPSDLNHDGAVNAGDLSILLGVWGSSGGVADLDGDGTVGSGDLAVLLAAWTV